jgi:hypothetical protein
VVSDALARVLGQWDAQLRQADKLMEQIAAYIGPMFSGPPARRRKKRGRPPTTKALAAEFVSGPKQTQRAFLREKLGRRPTENEVRSFREAIRRYHKSPTK